MAARRSLASIEAIRNALGEFRPLGGSTRRFVNVSTGEVISRRAHQTALNLQRFGLKVTPERAALRPERLAYRGPEPFRTRLARAYQAEHGLPNLRKVQSSGDFKDEYRAFQSLQRKTRKTSADADRAKLYRFFEQYDELYDDDGDRYVSEA